MSDGTFSRYDKNTFRIVYSNIPVKPSQNETIDFMVDTLKIAVEKVSLVQLNGVKGIVYVTMQTLEEAQALVSEHAGKHFLTHDGKKFPVTITMEDNTTIVKLRDLPPGIPDSDVKAALSVYGEVITITREVWAPSTRFAGVASGIRNVRMKITNPIKSFITLGDEVTSVSYPGQRQTCRSCQEPVHHGLNCVQSRQSRFRETLSQNKAPSQKASYANPLCTAPTPSPIQAASEPPFTVVGNKKMKNKPKYSSLVASNAKATVDKKRAAASTSKIAHRLIVPIRDVQIAINRMTPEVITQQKAKEQAAPMEEAAIELTAALVSDTAPTAAAPTSGWPSLPVLQPQEKEAVFKVPLDIPSHPSSFHSTDEMLGVKRKQTAETDNESDGSCPSTHSQSSVTKRKPGRPPKRFTYTPVPM
ncbi:uncharacterized protein LOC125774493 [Anopheles funestus]|uniref:uncharacterized protein LOC125774493 n=1 Tax=Anopheles funestus TaxID=62324 RepID=UPI0020C68F1E|nr:uncharacterized protein LOC125774493 [Anopheles funestus]